MRVKGTLEETTGQGAQVGSRESEQTSWGRLASWHGALCVGYRSVFGERRAQLRLVLKLGSVRELRGGRGWFAETVVQEENYLAAWGRVWS